MDSYGPVSVLPHTLSQKQTFPSHSQDEIRMGKSRNKIGHSISQELVGVGLIPEVLPEDFRGTLNVNVTFGVLNIDPGNEVPIGKVGR